MIDIDKNQGQGVLSPRAVYSAAPGGIAMKYFTVAAVVISAGVAFYFAALYGAIVAAAVAGAVALVAVAYGGVLGYVQYVTWRDDRRIKLERHFADMLTVNTELAVAVEDARTRRLAELKIESDGRETIIIDGDVLPYGARTITAKRNRALPENVPHTYSPRIEITHAPPAPALVAPGQDTGAAALPAIVPLMPGLETLRARGLIKKEDLSLYLGESAAGSVLASTVDVLMAAIVAGSGGGKSGFLRALLTQWYLHYLDGAAVQFALIDHDRRELPLWSRASNLLKWTNPDSGQVETAFSDDSERTGQLIAWLHAEMERRARLEESERERLPFIIVAIEEVIDVFGDVDATARGQLEKLMRRSRGVNFRIVCTAQYLRVSDVGKAVQSQSRSKFAGNLADDRPTATALGFDAKVVPHGRPGRFTFRLPDGTTGTVQTPFVTPGDVKALLTNRRDQGGTIDQDAPPAGNDSRAGEPARHGRPALRVLKSAGDPLPAWIMGDQAGDGQAIDLQATTHNPTIDQAPPAGQVETKEEAARRLWAGGYNSVRRLSDELTRLGYPGVASPDSARALINRLGLRTERES